MSLRNHQNERMEKTVRLLLAIFLCAFARVPLWAQNTLDKAGLTSATPAAVAYSVRQLSSSYTGNALLVRRSSDNATQDIGFTTNGYLDTAALKSFVGTGNGYVTIWYDQSGNGRNATQTATTQHPAIVLSGVVQRANSQTAVVFDGVSQTMASAALGLMSQPFTRNSVVTAIKGSNRKTILGSANRSPFNILSFYNGNNNVVIAAPNILGSLALPNNSPTVSTEQNNGAASQLFFNGNGTPIGNAGTNGVNGVQIENFDNSSNYFSNVAFSEIDVFPTQLSTTDRQTLEANQSNYYGMKNLNLTKWTGLNNNTNWFDSGNWSNGVPTSSISAIIPYVYPFPFPVISSAAQVLNLTINSNATLTVNNNLNVFGNLSTSGNIISNSNIYVAANLVNS
jgi:hypothetical protein